MRRDLLLMLAASTALGVAYADDSAPTRPSRTIEDPVWIICFAPKAEDIPFGDLSEERVVVEFTVNGEKGKPWTTDVVVLESSPPGVFDDIAVKTISTWAFKPLAENRKPVPARAKWTMVFDKSSLEGGRIQSVCKKV